MEQEWADWVNVNKEVKFEIRAIPADADRPDAFDVSYNVVDQTSGRTVYTWGPNRFLNEAGQTFERVPAADIRSWKE